MTIGKITRASVRPASGLDLLSHEEISGLTRSHPEVFSLFRNVALAVLNTDSISDDGDRLLRDYHDFVIRLIPQSRGLKLELENAPSAAFVDGRMIQGVRNHVFAALRDIVYTDHKIRGRRFDLDTPEGVTDAVFRILRNAGVVRPNEAPNLVVCWGGHSIDRIEYDYSKEVGYQMGLRGLDIVTGCGPGAMKGPMKGAAVGHAKQQIRDGRYIGITEPGIIASEPPNAIVNELVIMPDIEKRLEAFVRLAHCIVVFPGGVGTTEEILYVLSLLMDSGRDKHLPIIFAAPESRADYFESLTGFLERTLGPDVRDLYQVICGRPDHVAREARQAISRVQRHRGKTQEAYYYNWSLNIAPHLQEPFIPSHENMAALRLFRDLPPHQLASQLRCAFSGIVAGNVKPDGIERIARHGPYQLRGEPGLMAELDDLLQQFVTQGRMKLHEHPYQPCYQLVPE